MSTRTPAAPSTTTVRYRTMYMPANAKPRTKTFESKGWTASEALANNWIRNYGVTVLSIETTKEGQTR